MRTKLARTLLVLGVGLPACEHVGDISRPLADDRDRPAVGNIGQTGRPRVRFETGRPLVRLETSHDAAARPLEAGDRSPAVGNIGQTGAPDMRVAMRLEPQTGTPDRRVALRLEPPRPRVNRATATVRRPVVDHRERPAVGNIGQSGAPELVEVPRYGTNPAATPRDVMAAVPPRDVMAAVPPHDVDDALGQLADGRRIAIEPQRRRIETPLIGSRERPAVGNVMGKGKPRPTIAVERPQIIVEQRPLLDQRKRPAVGNVMGKRGGGSREDDRDDGLGFATDRPQALEPLVTPAQRPAVGNVMGKGRHERRVTDTLDFYVGEVEHWDRELREADSTERRAYCRMRKHDAAREADAERRRLTKAAP